MRHAWWVAVLSLSPLHALAGAPTVVSLTFDDGTAGQATAADLLAARGQRGTFYVNSGRVGFPAYLTWGQLAAMRDQGHEIGGHTTLHDDLTALPVEEATRTVCNDRNALLERGFAPRSFAYPFGATSSSVAEVVRSCGYNSARGVGGVRSLPYACASCPTAETIPPRNTYNVQTTDSVKSGTTLATLKGWVTQAEDSQGGWVNLVFHHVCDGCASNAISPAVLAQLLDWLAARPPTTTVRAVGDVIGGALQGPASPPPPPAGNLVQNASLESASGTVPTCFQTGGYGSNTATWSRVNDAHTGSWAARVDVAGWTSGDRKLVQRQDAGTCAPPAAPGRSYRLSVRYKGAFAAGAYAAVVTYYRDAGGVWRYWQTGPAVAPSAGWALASFTTAALPAGATALSFGLALVGAGNLVTDDYAAADGG